jgi:hypothetical protein
MSDLDFARHLLGSLPQVYRERDHRDGHLGSFLAAPGELLDRFHRTLLQRLQDAFPDLDPDSGAGAQAWLLPYIADLLDVRLASPDEAGRRAELADAIRWRQQKGTVTAVESVTEGIGQVEAEVLEGWKRTATTPRVGEPLLPAAVFGEGEVPDDASPALRARHPGLPAVTLDLRRLSRAVAADAGDPDARESRFGGELEWWRQIHRHGIPCFPGTYQDVARRTVDVRSPSWRQGHAHPRRIALHVPFPRGLCAEPEPSVDWSDIRSSGALVEITEEETSTTYRGLLEDPLRVTGDVSLAEDRLVRFENLWLEGAVTVEAGVLQLEGCAAARLIVLGDDVDEPALEARNSVIDSLVVPLGLARMEYVTVLGDMGCKALQGSDCVFAGEIRLALVGNTPPEAGCIRYSRITPATKERIEAVMSDPRLRLNAASCTTARPWFVDPTFGEARCGVLHPGCAAAIRLGGEDGGEMGAYHAQAHVLRAEATCDKLASFLPVGFQAVLVPDETLDCVPPKVRESS